MVKDKECPHCWKMYSKKGIATHIWRSHGEGKSFDPNKNTRGKYKKPWNKGLTKETSDVVQQYVNTRKEGNSYGTFSGKKHSDKTLNKMKANPNCGGYRKGSGRGKSGWYNGYWCDSSWELAYVIYNLEHGISFERNTEKFKYEFEGETHMYLPDFIEEGKYVEVKGYSTDQWEAKELQFKHDLLVIYKEEIKKYLKYVVDKYGKNFVDKYES